MPTVEIKHRYTGVALYTHETTDERMASGMAMRDALEAATKARANLAGANLTDANLEDANLAGANLAGANLTGAYRGSSPPIPGWCTMASGYLERNT